ncbi:MAG: LCP family protein [Candidatus Gracilibacteria bacterium]|jgi:LCP family protein required for cell wall assembly
MKKRNFISAILLGFLGISGVVIASFITFSQLPSLHFNFSLPFPGKVDLFQTISGTDQNKINLLVTGIGGGDHDGADLTDTILFVSLHPESKTISLLSIPRDLYVEYPLGGRGKINEIYMRGLRAKESQTQAMTDLGDKLREITGEKMDHYLNIDFDGFTKFIDLLGGVEVNIEEDLIDTEYPDNNWGYITFSIKKGRQILDGATALKYARSRHSTSDFDRSRRQQLVIKAVKDKLFSLDVLTSPTKIKSLYYAIVSHIKTDLSMGQLASLALFGKDIPTDNILAFNLNDSCFQGLAYCQRGGFLYTPLRELFGGASVLLPDGATPTHLDSYVDTSKFSNIVFNYPEMFLENSEISIINSTKTPGIANTVALYLKKFGFNIPDKDSIGSTKDIYDKTQVFSTWDMESKIGIAPTSKTLEALSLFIFAPQQMVPSNKYSKIPSPKIEVVLGKDYKTVVAE